MSFNNSIFLIVFLTLIIGGCKKNNIQKEGTFSILSYNVAGLPEFISSSSPETYTSSISPLLNNYDIVHVQEDFCYHDSLMLYNNHLYVTDPMPCVPDGDGLNTFSNYPIFHFERISWNDCHGPDCLTPKGFSYSQICVEDDVCIDFYNIHCNAGGSDPNLEARRGNIKQLVDYVNQHSQHEAIIIMGDFNNRYTREGDTIRALLEMGFSDVWIDVVRNGEIPPYGDKLKDCTPNETAINCETVDKVLYRNSDHIEFVPLEYQRGDNPDFFYQGIDSLPLSDHAPLYTKFSYIYRSSE